MEYLFCKTYGLQINANKDGLICQKIVHITPLLAAFKKTVLRATHFLPVACLMCDDDTTVLIKVNLFVNAYFTNFVRY